MFYYYNGNVTYLYCDYCCFYQKFLGAESPVNLLLHICFLFFESLPSRWPSGSRAINLCLICATRQFGQLGLGFVFTSPIKARVYVICTLFCRLCLEIKVKLCPRRGNDIFSCDAKPPRRPSLDHLRPVTAAVTSLQLSHSLSVLRCSLLILTQSAKTQTDLESWTIVFSFK